MDEGIRRGRGSENQPYIRHKVKFTVNGRTHTLETTIPLPVGVRAEQRAQLIREAEAGLQQAMSFIERGVNPVQARPGASAPAGQPSRAPQPAPRPAPAVRESAPAYEEDGEEEEPQRRQPANERAHRPVNMPSLPDLGNPNGDLSIPQFLRLVQDNFQLSPKQAMELLNVRSLQNINRRDAFERLRYLVRQEQPAARSQAQARPAPESARRELDEAPRRRVSPHDTQIEYRFDEEDESGPDAEAFEEGEDEEEDLAGIIEEEEEDEEAGPREEGEEAYEGEEEGEEPEPRRELSIQERVHAKALVSRLREKGGSTNASSGRITVLWNVIGSQISEDQLQDLIKFVWGASTLKQLKIDQLEALISWAKEDDFENEVDAVLALM